MKKLYIVGDESDSQLPQHYTFNKEDAERVWNMCWRDGMIPTLETVDAVAYLEGQEAKIKELSNLLVKVLTWYTNTDYHPTLPLAPPLNRESDVQLLREILDEELLSELLLNSGSY